ncbi:MAG: fumarylacetoacetate hydrolase family protein [Clostridia bacterium]|nr:fumarylacetoacetate hydrolase family protein [Clostridia bacterium]
MKLLTFEVATEVGPFARLGALLADGAIVDLNFACAARLAARGAPFPNERADQLLPSDMVAFARTGEDGLELARDVLAWLAGAGEDQRGPRGERIRWDEPEVRYLPPVLRVPVLRDFAAFEEHLKNTFGKMGVSLPEAWYRRPMAFKGSPTALFGHKAEIPWPAYTARLDYEMEICAVIGKPGRDIPPERAMEHVLGFTVLNDFSARDVQAEEMSNHTGPFKGKDFAWGLGPWIATRDEIADPSTVRMSVRVNGELWAESSPRTMRWSFAELVSYTSCDETLAVGDLLGSGTVDGGCGFEIDRWLQPGDVVEVTVEGVGTLAHRIGRPRAGALGERWRPRA